MAFVGGHGDQVLNGCENLFCVVQQDVPHVFGCLKWCGSSRPNFEPLFSGFQDLGFNGCRGLEEDSPL